MPILQKPSAFFPAEARIESFLTDLAVHANVAPATQRGGIPPFKIREG